MYICPPNMLIVKNQQASKLLPLKNGNLVPTPQAGQIILSYFMNKNYQDFNTWQQIARAKSDFQFLQTAKGTTQCRMTLKWEDKSANILPMVQIAQGKNKKDVKKKVLQKMIRDLMIQGYICKGFKDHDFLKKLPKRRKQESSESQDEQTAESMKNQNKMKQLLIQGNLQQALGLITEENFIQIWHYALNKRSFTLCKKVVLFLQQKPYDSEQMQLEQKTVWQGHCEEQSKESKQEELSKTYTFQIDPRYDDLTDFLQYYQLQCKSYKQNMQGYNIQWRQIPSETLYGKYGKRQELFKEFFPIEKTLDIQNHYIRQMKKKYSSILHEQKPYFKLPYTIMYPNFDQSLPILYRTVEILYDSLFFYGYDIRFCLKVINLLTEIKQISIKKDSKRIEDGQKIAGNYFLKHKYLIVLQFLSLIQLKIQNPFLSIEGMITQTSGKSANTLLTFITKQPQQYVSQKVSKKPNTSEFQQSFQINISQYVLIVSKVDPSQKYIAYVKETSPNLRIQCPQLPFQLNVPKPFTLFKIANAKLYQRTSNALTQICKYLLYNNPVFFQTNVRIFLQPPINNGLSLLIQLLSQLSAQESVTLLISPSAQLLYEQLTKYGFRCAKVTPKFDDKSIIKTQVVCSTPNAICSQALKNYTFEKVIINEAHQVSQVMTFACLSKGCNKLFLIGDTKFPKTKVLSNYCLNKGMNISLMERLIRTGHSYCTYYSASDQLQISPSILEWPNSYFYKNQLLQKIAGYHQMPIVKGFPWPVQDISISFIDTSNDINCQQTCAIRIIFSLLRTGFIQLDQICCIVNQPQTKFQLGKQIYRILKEHFQTQDNCINPAIIDKTIKLIDGQRPSLREFSVVLSGDIQWTQEQLNACFFYAKRGVVFLGDVKRLKTIEVWDSFLSWCAWKKVILKYKANQ